MILVFGNTFGQFTCISFKRTVMNLYYNKVLTVDVPKVGIPIHFTINIIFGCI